MAVLSDGQMIVGDGTTDPVAESGATLRTSIGCNPVAGSTSITTTGALNTGSITSDFGNIDNGSSTLDTGAATVASLVLGGHSVDDVDLAGEFVDSDNHLMSAAAINDRFAQINANTTGTAATVTGAAQGNITSLGTLTALSVDNITVDANTVSATNTNGNVLLAPNGTGYVELKGNTNAGAIRFNCEDNSHGVTIKGPAHSAGATYTLTLPTDDGDNGQILKTNGSGVLDWVDNSGSYTHPNHSGEVTSTADGAQVIADNVVDEANLKVSNAPTNGYMLTAQSGNTGGLTWAAASGGSGGIGTADQTLDADRTIDTDGFNLAIELDPAANKLDTFTIHDGTHDLFQVDTTTTGTIFGVNDVSGLPKFTVNDADGVTINKFKQVNLEKTAVANFSHQGEVIYIGTGTTTQGELCYYKADGTWAATDADATATAGGVLLAIALGTDPDSDGMLLRGMFTLDHDPGTIADELYVSTTAGDITGTAPTGSGDIVRLIGYCLDSTNGQIWFNPSNDFTVV
jgi:hypothetical protein